MNTRIEVQEESPYQVRIYVRGRLRVRQPYSPYGVPWQSAEEALSWALARAQEGIDTCGWPELEAG